MPVELPHDGERSEQGTLVSASILPDLFYIRTGCIDVQASVAANQLAEAGKLADFTQWLGKKSVINQTSPQPLLS